LVDVNVDSTIVGDAGGCLQAVLFIVDLTITRRRRFLFGGIEREELGVSWKRSHGRD
jgi:hypothetical protein